MPSDHRLSRKLISGDHNKSIRLDPWSCYFIPAIFTLKPLLDQVSSTDVPSGTIDPTTITIQDSVTISAPQSAAASSAGQSQEVRNGNGPDARSAVPAPASQPRPSERAAPTAARRSTWLAARSMRDSDDSSGCELGEIQVGPVARRAPRRVPHTRQRGSTGATPGPEQEQEIQAHV